MKIKIDKENGEIYLYVYNDNNWRDKFKLSRKQAKKLKKQLKKALKPDSQKNWKNMIWRRPE